MSRTAEELRIAIDEFDGACKVGFEGGYVHVREADGWHRIADLATPAVVDGEEHESPARAG